MADKEIKRLVIFAGYDKDNIIDDYVVYFIKELKKVADIIYVSDCDMLDSEIEKISSYCTHIINGRHEEYDFGSYKRGYLYAYKKNILKNYTYLIFCNDSNFGPIFPIELLFEKVIYEESTVYGNLKHLKVDFSSKNNVHKLKTIDEHLQSHFVIIPQFVFLSEWFYQFINKIKKYDKIKVVNNYEIGMGRLFTSHNIKMVSLYDEDVYNKAYSNPIELIEKGYPFIKKVMKSLTLEEIKYIFEILKNHYDINLIINYYYRYSNEYMFGNKKEIEKQLENEILEKYKLSNENNIFTILKIKSFSILKLEISNTYLTIYILGIRINIKRL